MKRLPAVGTVRPVDWLPATRRGPVTSSTAANPAGFKLPVPGQSARRSDWIYNSGDSQPIARRLCRLDQQVFAGDTPGHGGVLRRRIRRITPRMPGAPQTIHIDQTTHRHRSRARQAAG